MAYFYDKNTPVPLGMFHPRWLYDGPTVLTKKWEMTLDNTAHIRQVKPSRAVGERYTSQRFANRGSQLIIDTAFEMAEYHKSLPAGEGTKFAALIQSINKSIIRRQDEKLFSLNNLPPRLPKPLPTPQLAFGPGKKRALTGREVAKREEIGQSHICRKAENVAKLQELADARIVAADIIKRKTQDEMAAAFYDLPISEDELDDAKVKACGDDNAKQGGTTNGFVDIDDYPLEKELEEAYEYQHFESDSSSSSASITTLSMSLLLLLLLIDAVGHQYRHLEPFLNADHVSLREK
jgi:hypothetical protein